MRTMTLPFGRQRSIGHQLFRDFAVEAHAPLLRLAAETNHTGEAPSGEAGRGDGNMISARSPVHIVKQGATASAQDANWRGAERGSVDRQREVAIGRCRRDPADRAES